MRINNNWKIQTSPGRDGFENSAAPGQGEGGWFENPRFFYIVYKNNEFCSFINTVMSPQSNSNIYGTPCKCLYVGKLITIKL